MVNSKNMSSFKLQFNWKEFYFTQELCFSSLRVPRWKCHLTKSVMDNKKAWKEGRESWKEGVDETLKNLIKAVRDHVFMLVNTNLQVVPFDWKYI